MKKVDNRQELHDFIVRTLRAADTIGDAENIRVTETQAAAYSKNQISIFNGNNEGHYIELTETHGNHDLTATIRFHYYPSLINSFEALADAFIKDGRG